MASRKSSRRRSERVAIKLPVRWRRGQRIIEAITGDISGEGLFVGTQEQVPPGSLMHLEVDVPGEPPLAMFVTAMFVGQTTNGAGIGAEIFVMSEPERRRWRRFYLGLLRERLRAPTTSVSQDDLSKAERTAPPPNPRLIGAA